MKKLFAILFSSLLVLSSPASVLATENNAKLTFLESIENTQKLSSYHQKQSFNVSAAIEEFSEKIKVDVRAVMNSDVINEGGIGTKLNTNVNLQIRAKNESEGAKEFENAIANLDLDMRVFLNEGLYLKLNKLNVQVRGIEKEEQEMIKSFLDTVHSLKNQWIFIDFSELPEGTTNEEFQTELQTLIQEEGFLEGVRQGIRTSMEQEGASEEEITFVTETLFNRVVSAPLFSIKDKAVNGKTWTEFKLNKKEVLKLIKSIAADQGEEISSELSEIRKVLNKFNIAGRLHKDMTYRIWDEMEGRITVNNLEALKKGHLRFTTKIDEINAILPITAPENAMTLEELQEAFNGF